MRKFLLVTAATVCVLGTPAFATTGTFHAQGPFVQGQDSGSSTAQAARNSLLVVADNDDKGKDKDKDKKKDKDKCDDDVSRSKPCKENDGHGHGDGDGSPDRDR